MRLPTRLLRRSPDAHKGNFGHIFILASSARFSGAGLVTLGIPKSLNTAMIKIKPKEVMILPLAETKEGTLSINAYQKIKDFTNNIDVLAIGPGLTENRSTQSLVRKVIFNINRPTVIDADGLNALIGHLDLLRVMKILTPHPGEMARLLGVSIKKVK